MLGIRAAWRDVSEYSPAESVFGSQPVLPGEFLSAPEPPSPSFLKDFQGVLASRRPLATAHHSQPGLETLPEQLLLSRFVLIRRDGAQPPLSPAYDGPYLVLERSLRFFKVQLGNRVEVVSTLRLKACHTPPDTVAADPPRRGRPPTPAHASLSVPDAADCSDVLPASKQSASMRPPPVRGRPRRVSFAWPPATVAVARPTDAPRPSSRPSRTVRRPCRLGIDT